MAARTRPAPSAPDDGQLLLGPRAQALPAQAAPARSTRYVPGPAPSGVPGTPCPQHPYEAFGKVTGICRVCMGESLLDAGWRPSALLSVQEIESYLEVHPPLPRPQRLMRAGGPYLPDRQTRAA